MAAFDEIGEMEKNCKQTYFLRDLLKKRVEFLLPKQETIDIIEAVEYLVNIIVARIASNVDWLKVSRVVRVGSMAERTSIMQPDEFDFLVVLEHNGVEVHRDKCRNGHAHLQVSDPKLRSLWGKWLRCGYLKGAFTRGFLDVLRSILSPIKNGILHQLKENIVSKVYESYFNTLGDAFLFEVASVIRNSELSSRRSTGTMFVLDVGKHGPAFMPTFKWQSHRPKFTLDITVDITPAIEVEIPPRFINRSEVFHDKFWQKLQKRGKMMLIPDHKPDACELGLCFRLTFTETEVELMKELSTHHLDVYKLLKYIFNSQKGYKYLPSYVYKTMILKHSCFCNETENIAICFKNIVAECLHYLLNRRTEEKMEITRLLRLFIRGVKFELFIPSIFMKSHNILESKDFPFPCEIFLFEIENMLQSLEDISSFSCDGPSGAKFEVLDKTLKIVNSHKCGLQGYLSALPFVNRHLYFNQCIKCLGIYFRRNSSRRGFATTMNKH